jgi:hypothetical protein
MADIVNLNRFRKDRKRDEEKQQSATNRAQHGRTKAEREREEIERKRRDDLLDGQKIDPE